MAGTLYFTILDGWRPVGKVKTNVHFESIMSKITTSRNRWWRASRRVSLRCVVVFVTFLGVIFVGFGGRARASLSPSSFRGKFEFNKARQGRKRDRRPPRLIAAPALPPDFRVDAQEKKVNRPESESDSNYGHEFFTAILFGSRRASCAVFTTANQEWDSIMYSGSRWYMFHGSKRTHMHSYLLHTEPFL